MIFLQQELWSLYRAIKLHVFFKTIHYTLKYFTLKKNCIQYCLLRKSLSELVHFTFSFMSKLNLLIIWQGIKTIQNYKRHLSLFSPSKLSRQSPSCHIVVCQKFIVELLKIWCIATYWCTYDNVRQSPTQTRSHKSNWYQTTSVLRNWNINTWCGNISWRIMDQVSW